MPLPDPNADLQFALTTRDLLRAAYQDMVTTGPKIMRYQIGDVSVEYRNSSDMRKDLNHWEQTVQRLQMQQGIRPANRLKMRL